MKNFDFGTLKYNYVAVHCNSQNELDNFIKQCEENDIIVGPDREFDKSYGYIIVDSERLYCDYVAALKNEDYDIIEWKIENKIDYDREYNILEIKEFPEETEFVNEDIYVVKFKDGILQVKNKTKNTLDSWSKCLITREWLNAKFKLVKKDRKVSFEEAIQTYNVYKTIKCIWLDDIYEFDGSKESKLTNVDEDRLLNLILEGEWYIKEE
ncbi:hypothetical protein CF069_19165 [Clostridium botulinum]